MKLIPKTKVYSHDKKFVGFITGGTRKCQMEGCAGHRIGVRWTDGKLTWPCESATNYYKDGIIIL